MQARALRRHVLSVPGLGVLLLALALGAVALLGLVSSWSEQRALGQALDSARVISDLAVRRNLEPQSVGVATPGPLQQYALQQDVNLLHASRRLVGLEVWRTDGTALFTDAGHPAAEVRLPAAVLARAAADRAWVVQAGPGARGTGTVDAYLPYTDGQGQVAAVVKVLLPQQELTRSIERATAWSRRVAAPLVVGVFAALLALRRRLRSQEHRARHDSLTGLLNRGALLEDATRVLATGRPAALLVLDLDGFKAINDTLGHAAGDALLAQVGRTLRAAVRTQDVVARLGGDEFAVLLVDLPKPAQGADVAGLVLERLRAGEFAVHGVALAVDASIGVAAAPEHGRTVQELLQRADIAMYQAKATHSGTALYDPATDHHDVGQLAMLVELRDALHREELVLHYQPQVALETGEVVGVEALVRWQHPTRGLLPPNVFIPLAEPTGLMHPLTDRVLRAALQQAATWRRAGRPLRVAVNISPRTLLEGDLPGTVALHLAETEVGADLLELEITETAVMSDPLRAAEVVARLHDLGVKVSIDDFGSGYTSLSYLTSLPVQALKIDRGLVMHLGRCAGSDAVVEAVVGLGHRLGLQVLAEGVETEAVLDRLRALGCDQVQGYLLTRPLPAAELERWLASARPRAAFAAAAPAGH